MNGLFAGNNGRRFGNGDLENSLFNLDFRHEFLADGFREGD